MKQLVSVRKRKVKQDLELLHSSIVAGATGMSAGGFAIASLSLAEARKTG